MVSPADRLDEAARAVLRAADRDNLRIATAESCTGGLIASLLTDIDGLGHVFERGFIVYSDDAKCELLALDRDLLAGCNAVSAAVAVALARGAVASSHADIAVGVTGFAGPAGDDDEEGLVHIACARRSGAAVHREFHFGAAGRTGVREAAAREALSMIERAIATSG